MKTIYIKLLACILPFLCTSCFKVVDFGFPNIAVFKTEGGMKTVSGNTSFTHAEIQDYNSGKSGTVEAIEDGRYRSVLGWLQVEYNNLSNDELKIYAEPNTTGKTRKLYIEIYSGPEYAIIKVIQN